MTTNYSILIVDDEDDYREMFSLILKEKGYHAYKAASVKEVREKDATKLIEKAVKGMLQHNTLGAEQFNKLKVYCGPEHPHAAQKPVVLGKESK